MQLNVPWASTFSVFFEQWIFLLCIMHQQFDISKHKSDSMLSKSQVTCCHSVPLDTIIVHLATVAADLWDQGIVYFHSAQATKDRIWGVQKNSKTLLPFDGSWNLICFQLCDPLIPSQSSSLIVVSPPPFPPFSIFFAKCKKHVGFPAWSQTALYKWTLT